MNFIKTQKRSVKQMALRLVRVQRHLSQLDDGMMSHLLRKFDRKKYQATYCTIDLRKAQLESGLI